jgi:23S rRNA (guanosine2251-2'-O)-methyltransferase
MFPVERINRITRKNHQGAVAYLSAVSYVPVEELVNLSYEQGKDPLFVLLDQVSDVRNFGAIARSAECFGFNGIIVPHKGAARINADSVKTSAGALLKINVSRAKSLPNTIKYLKDSGIRVVAVTEKTKNPCYKADLAGPVVIVLGSEDEGISENLLHLCDEKVQIPMTGETESLKCFRCCIYFDVRN